MKTFYKSAALAMLAIIVGVGTALATEWLGSSSADQMYMYGGNDVIVMGGGDDIIKMGTGNDVITFYDGDATLKFHEAGTPATPVYIEYLESDENLTVYTAQDFVIRLGN